jgi:hypothetical protein
MYFFPFYFFGVNQCKCASKNQSKAHLLLAMTLIFSKNFYSLSNIELRGSGIEKQGLFRNIREGPSNSERTRHPALPR